MRLKNDLYALTTYLTYDVLLSTISKVEKELKLA